MFIINMFMTDSTPSEVLSKKIEVSLNDMRLKAYLNNVLFKKI